MKKYTVFLIFTLAVLVATSSAAAVTKSDVLNALESALADGRVDQAEKLNILSILENYLAVKSTAQQTPVTDLVLDSITVTPVRPVINEAATVKAVIRNAGNQDVLQNFKITALSKNSTDKEFQVKNERVPGPLAAGKTLDYEFPIVYSNAGVYQLFVELDSYNVVSESNEVNNNLDLGRVLNIGPDLIVTDVTIAPELPQATVPFTVKVAIANNGATPTGTFHTWVKKDDEPSVACIIATSLKASESSTQTCDTQVTFAAAGKHKLKVTTDTAKDIAEYNEDNNYFEKEVIVS